MARLEPFAAIRYDPARVVPDDVVSPPYDVVGPAERARLADTSPYNAIHVELPDRATRSGSRPVPERLPDLPWLARCRHRGRDSRVGFYLYRMTFHDERGQPRVMTGLLGALGLDLHGAGDVLAHEQTIPKDRLDRLSILRSTRLNTSPIWGLSPAKGLTARLPRGSFADRRDTAGGPPTPPGSCTRSGPWPTSAALAEITALVASAPCADRRRPSPLRDRLHLCQRMPGGERRQAGALRPRSRLRRRAARRGAVDRGDPPARERGRRRATGGRARAGSSGSSLPARTLSRSPRRRPRG